MSGSSVRSNPKTTMEIIILLIQLAIVILIIAGVWKTFAKAGQPGWAAIIPIFNVYILLKVANRPWWWLLLLLIPLVNLVIMIIVAIDIAKAFDKGAGFGIGLALLGFIFYPILGFSEATYTQPVRTA